MKGGMSSLGHYLSPKPPAAQNPNLNYIYIERERERRAAKGRGVASGGGQIPQTARDHQRCEPVPSIVMRKEKEDAQQR